MHMTWILWLLLVAGCAAVLVVVICIIWRATHPESFLPAKLESLILEFKTPSGWKHEVTCSHRPLGLGFYESLVPLTVAYVGEEAVHLGVLKGDMLTAMRSDQRLVQSPAI